MFRNLMIAASALALAACATGPDYAAPQTPATSAGAFIAASPAVDTLKPVKADWWRLYDDPVLDQLVADAIAANTDVRVAVARLEKARAALREVRTDRLPDVGAGAGATYGRLPESQRASGAPREDWSIDAGLDVAYEVDLFGRVSRGIEAARGDLGAAEADLEAVRISVVAETTRAYATAASAGEQIAVAERIVELLDRSLRVTDRRRAVGLTTSLDVARIATLRNQRQAEIPVLTAERNAALFRLATLTGRAPADLPPIAAERVSTLRLDTPIPIGDGAQLLARRPDIRAAERRLAAATARIGVSTADLYPRISLGASIGSTGPNIGDVFGGGPLRWLLGPLISWSFTDHERARARVAGAEADTRAALAGFDGTVLRSLEETETALSAYASALDRRTALKAARDAAEQAARIVRAQQREGQVDSLALIDAERTFAETEAQLAAIDAGIADAQINLFKALGGGWSAGAAAYAAALP
jgi:NodT family efflux transporter outer membrane factor (OMF) lipoprotein